MCVCLEFAAFISRLYTEYDIPVFCSPVFRSLQSTAPYTTRGRAFSHTHIFYPGREWPGVYATHHIGYGVQAIVHTNEQKYCNSEVDNININENGPPEHLWSQIAPNTEEARARALAEGSQVLTDVSQEDLRDNAALMTNTTTSLHARFESASNTDVIAADEYQRLLRELNDEQRAMVMFHRDWCKKAVLALKQSKPIEPYIQSIPKWSRQSWQITCHTIDTLRHN